MPRRTSAPSVGVLILAFAGLGIPCALAGPAARRIVVQSALPVLPEPLRATCQKLTDAIIEYAEEPENIWPRDVAFRAREHWHYLLLDVAATKPDAESRRQAAREFPHAPSAARNLFRSHEVVHGGRLPWQLELLVGDLAGALAGGDEKQIATGAGHLIHFVCDAADPFSVSRNRRGQETGNADLGTQELGDPRFAHQDVAHRIGWELIRRNEYRYCEAVLANVGHIEEIADPLDAIFETMNFALASHDTLCQADRALFQRMQLDDPSTLLQRSDEFYPLLDEACGSQCVENLAAASRLAGALILHAWRQAGSPPLQHVGNATLPPAPPTVAAPPTADTTASPPPPAETPRTPGRFCASRNSRVFHRADCPHALRINPENLVWFDSLKDALDSGRRPCKTCRPDSG